MRQDKLITRVSLKPIFAFLGVDLREVLAVKFVGLKEKTLFDNLNIVGLLIVPEILEFCRRESNFASRIQLIDKIFRQRNQSFE